MPSIHALLLAAQQAHEIRDDLDIDQILDLLHAVASINAATSHVQPILQAAIDGLRPSAAQATGTPPWTNPDHTI